MPKDKSKQGKMARNKGARGELELSHIIRDQWGYDVHRGKVFYGESDLIGLDCIHIECKRVEKLNIHKAMQQAITEADKRKDGLPAVFHRKNNEDWLVTMRLEDWMDLYGEWRND